MELDEELYNRQIALETESVDIAVANYRKQLSDPKISEADLPPGIALMKRIMQPYIASIKQFMIPKRGGMHHGAVRRDLSKLSTEEVAYIASRRIFESIQKDEPIQRIAISISDRLDDQVELNKYKREAKYHYEKVIDSIKSSDKRHKRTVVLYAKRKIGIQDDTAKTDQEKLGIGSKLIELFVESTGLVEIIPEANKSTAPGKVPKYILKATQETLEWLQKHHSKCEVLAPFYLPMVAPPRPWTTIDDGGFYSLPLTLVKTRDKQALESLKDNDMPLVYNAINAIQQTPWRINKKVYEIVSELWSTSQTLGGLPSQNELPQPEKPWNTDAECEVLKKERPEIFIDWKRRAADVYADNVALASKRSLTAAKMFIADKYKDEERFYFCWNLDWRGRLYPVQGNLNPQADDIGKALLEFTEGKPLGEEGIYWLKIHTANEYGVDKVSFEERIKWVDDNIQYILDSASNPLDGTRFWADADSPYMFLAACFEIKGYMEQGESYISHLPIALDGSCNGLQNFSAMLRDSIGGRAVNLIPQDTPNDIYMRVAEKLIKVVEEDANDFTTMYPPKSKKKKDVEEEENEVSKQVPLSQVASLWLGKIDRKICKRGVMTTPYGAKRRGMTDQLLDELAKRDKNYLGVDDPFQACTYLGGRLYDTIREVVIAAKDAMDWLQEVAKYASKENSAITWRTPAGFIPRQYYLEQRAVRIDTFFGGMRIRLSLNEDIPDKLDKRKQGNGIAPNFVHSMDASHLMLTVNKCINEAGITDFAMIHDSYGTHACDTGKLSALLREAFIEQYSNDVLRDFREEVQTQLGDDVTLPGVPKKGTLDLSLVKDSKYFFA